MSAVISRSWDGSGRVYGYRKVGNDLQDMGERCPSKYGGRPAAVVPNYLDRQFEPDEPNEVWATDITYIRTHDGWLYLAVVLDLFSRQVVD